MRTALLLLTVIVASRLAVAETGHLPAEHRRAIENIAHFHMLKSKAELPDALVRLCAHSPANFAEPDGKWEPTDVITDASLPNKRMIWAATDGAYFIIHYESGGIAHSYRVLVARTSPNEQKVDFVWFANTKPLKNLEAFREALLANKFDDDPRLFR